MHSIRTKIMCITLGVTAIVMLAFSFLFPNFFFFVMREHLYKQISGIVNADALRQSYIWNGNNHINDTIQDPTVLELLCAWSETPVEDVAGRERLAADIVRCLPTGRTHSAQDYAVETESYGYILCSDLFILVTEDGGCFCEEAQAELASRLVATPQVQQLPLASDFMGHLAIATDPLTGIMYLPVAETFQAGEMNCLMLRMVMLPDVLHQFQDLVNLGISDYMICAGREVLYSNLGDDTHIVLAECPDEMFAPIQYQVNHFESDDRTVFSALCTYIEEDLRIFVSVSREDIVSPYARVFQSFRLLLILISAILLAAFWITLQHALRRLNRLEKEMNRVQLGDYDIHISDNSGDEISSLTHSLQIMLDKIKCDMKENERMQYALLVSAIDPHYLYNTLNTVTALAELGKTQEAAAVNNALIGTLKDRLRMKNYKIFDTVRAEMDALDNYMLIQDYLSFVKIDYSFHVAAEDENLMIPKNIIQPLVENSIKHGILCKDFAPDEVKRGRIAVALCRSDAGISITVEDDGVGMDEATLEKYFVADNRKRWQKENVEHIGILNALMRLDYLYGGNYGVTARNRESGGLFIAQQLPLEAKL